MTLIEVGRAPTSSYTTAKPKTLETLFAPGLEREVERWAGRIGENITM
jgi:hypothetical protein